jgi:hypothetical protein
MGDVKDILGVPRAGPHAEKHEKAKEPKLVKPKGMSRCEPMAPPGAASSPHAPGESRARRSATSHSRFTVPPGNPLPAAAQGGVCAAERLSPAGAIPAGGRPQEEVRPAGHEGEAEAQG